jgi:septal ring factor EnvC (AmiA/AmiB activator)
MSGFRGSDESLDREIAAVETIARVRLRRASAELRELARDLRELKRERARRRAEAEPPSSEVASGTDESSGPVAQ